MARPTKHEHEKRSQRFNLRFTTAELDHVKTQAEIAGLEPSEYLRRRALGYTVPSKAAARTDPGLVNEINKLGNEVSELGRELNAIGVNANQLALASNAGRRARIAWEDVVAGINELRQRVASKLECVSSKLEEVVFRDS